MRKKDQRRKLWKRTKKNLLTKDRAKRDKMMIKKKNFDRIWKTKSEKYFSEYREK